MKHGFESGRRRFSSVINVRCDLSRNVESLDINLHRRSSTIRYYRESDVKFNLNFEFLNLIIVNIRVFIDIQAKTYISYMH